MEKRKQNLIDLQKKIQLIDIFLLIKKMYVLDEEERCEFLKKKLLENEEKQVELMNIINEMTYEHKQ